ncbi:Do family serine endopeptidase [Massilia norwichensis]|uniref:Probable periplasmic serine endoprotease DegP-like n=1 Tax=Massilia norwichensis TaxID=1442366 RepID=A0ABT2A714_9BURK|nr:Do family serine endopeptidase [Massilia norwichensis]MCS0589967.1 Do family serine endopeptidase [Massilia norwichensis]
MQNETAMSAKRLTLALCAAGVIGGAVGAVAVNHNNATAAAEAAAAAGAPVAAQAAAPAVPVPATAAPVAGNPAATGLPDFTKIVSHNGPAVVNVRVVGSTKVAQRQMPQFDEDDPFFEFFRRFQPQQPRGNGGGREVVIGAGSGFIVSPDGVILTNAHVVRDADEVTVKLQDRREYRAKVLGSDPKTDVAVLKVDAKNLPTVPVGNSRSLQVGEWVLAIGSPYGLESSVTAGVVSAKGRNIDTNGVQFIQTDVAVNPGNSGGPLFNTRGEVVGINSQIYSQTGGYQGLSFAIPIDVAVRIKDQIVATGKVQHAKLGIGLQDVGQDFADSFKLDSPDGALVRSVERGSAAEKAGLKSGDVIRKVNGQPIVSGGDLSAIVSIAKPGDRVALDVWRDGKIIQVNATLANANDKPERANRDSLAGLDKGAKLGLSLRPLDPMERRQSGIASGLLVEDAGGPAQVAGIQPGDVLLSVNGKPVNSVEQVRDVVGKSSKSVALLIQRGDDKIFIPVRIG